MVFSEKCLPTSRKNCVTDRFFVQSLLFTRRAACSPSKSTNRESWLMMRSAHSATWSSANMARSPTSRGSPIMPVAPPASTIGLCPACWKRRSIRSGTKCPACRDGPVGSNPQYKVMGCSHASRSWSRSVDWLIRPRHCSSSIMLFVIVFLNRHVQSGWRVLQAKPSPRQ